MKKDEIKAKAGNPFDSLHKILDTIPEIPDEKRNNIRWLARNFDVIAPDHPKAKQVHLLFKKLLFIKKV